MGKPSTCLAHIELKWIPGDTFARAITCKTGKKLSECVLNDHRSSSLPEIRFKGRLWVIFRAFGASLWRPSAPTMAPMNRLWGALGLAGWGPRAPRSAPEDKVEKVKKRNMVPREAMFLASSWMKIDERIDYQIGAEKLQKIHT